MILFYISVGEILNSLSNRQATFFWRIPLASYFCDFLNFVLIWINKKSGTKKTYKFLYILTNNDPYVEFKGKAICLTGFCYTILSHLDN